MRCTVGRIRRVVPRRTLRSRNHGPCRAVVIVGLERRLDDEMETRQPVRIDFNSNVAIMPFLLPEGICDD